MTGFKSLREWVFVKDLNMLKIMVPLHLSFKVKQLNHNIGANKVNAGQVYPLMAILMLSANIEFCKKKPKPFFFSFVLMFWL